MVYVHVDGYVTSTCLWIHVTSTCAWLCYRENVCEYVKLPLHKLDVYNFIGMLYCMDWSSCFIDSVSFFLSFSLFLSFLLLQEYPSISCQKPW